MDQSSAILHPSHPNHPLTLLSAPAYPSGSFSCDACGELGTGYSYSCLYCRFDIHVKCATLREKVEISDKHHHELNLEYRFVVNNNSTREIMDSNNRPVALNCTFGCDVCKGAILNTIWKYDCRGCNFDAHVGCVEDLEEGIVNGGVSGSKRSSTRAFLSSAKRGFKDGVKNVLLDNITSFVTNNL